MIKKYLSLTFLSLFFIFGIANAASIKFDGNYRDAKVGDTVFVKVYLDTQGQEINAAEGQISIDGPAQVTFINVGGSIFSLWPIKPSYLNNEISFAGGTPSGVFGGRLKLFDVALKFNAKGQILLTFKNGSAYANDGRGTKIDIVKSSEEIVVDRVLGDQKNEVEGMVLGDKIAPPKFSIELGRDNDSFEGKYFLSFYASDNDSGINRYEVKEGSNPPVRSGNTYVLRDQGLKSKVEVVAYDNAGNFTKSVFEPQNPIFNFKSALILIVIFGILIGGYLWFIRFKRK